MSTPKRRQRRKRCLGCGELFYPDRRVGQRQHHCGRSECQKARKRAYQRLWRDQNPSNERGRRLRDDLARISNGGVVGDVRPREPLEKVPWDEVSAELGAETVVVLRCVVGVLVRWWVASAASSMPAGPPKRVVQIGAQATGRTDEFRS